MEPPLSMSDFLKAISITRPTVSENDLLQYVKFTEDFGQES